MDEQPKVETGEWVAVKDHAVISVGTDPRVLLDELDARGVQDFEVFNCSEKAIIW